MTDKIEVPTVDQIYQWSLGWRKFDASENWTTEERILRCAARLIHEALLREAALSATFMSPPDAEELARLRADAERLDFMAREQCILGFISPKDKYLYRVEWPFISEVQCEWSKTPREDIDGAIAAQKEGE